MLNLYIFSLELGFPGLVGQGDDGLVIRDVPLQDLRARAEHALKPRKKAQETNEFTNHNTSKWPIPIFVLWKNTFRNSNILPRPVEPDALQRPLGGDGGCPGPVGD